MLENLRRNLEVFSAVLILYIKYKLTPLAGQLQGGTVSSIV